MADLPVPGTELSDVDDLGGAIPSPVDDLLRALWGAGHAAYVVGGALRDAILDRPTIDWDLATAAMVGAAGQFTPDARAVRAYQQVNTVYAGLTAFTDPLFRSMAGALHGLERA